MRNSESMMAIPSMMLEKMPRSISTARTSNLVTAKGWTSLYEVGYNGFNVDDGAELPGWYRLGAWYHSSEFATNAGGKKEGNGGIYGAVDKMLTRDGLGAFARLGISERDRSRFHWVLDTGFNYTGLIPGRDEDVTALGLCMANTAVTLLLTNLMKRWWN